MALRKKKDGIKYISHDPNLQDWIRDFSRHLKTHPENNVVWYPESFATGYAKVFEVMKGLSCRIVEYTLNTDFLFERASSDEFYLILYFYSYKNCCRLQLKINGRAVIDNENADYSSLLMTNSFATQQLRLTKGTVVQGLTIQLSREWLMARLSPSAGLTLDIFEQKDVFQTLIRPRYRRLLNEIFEMKEGVFVADLYASVRVVKLIEIFFEQIFQNGLQANVLPASTRDVQSLFAVEQYLLQNYREPFPTINMLSRMAMMSSSKLKETFKRAFAVSLFEYFQRNRMYRARDLLLTGLYSVTEVGELLGYQNLSNFSAAFKKEFGVLPKNADQVA